MNHEETIRKQLMAFSGQFNKQFFYPFVETIQNQMTIRFYEDIINKFPFGHFRALSRMGRHHENAYEGISMNFNFLPIRSLIPRFSII